MTLAASARRLSHRAALSAALSAASASGCGDAAPPPTLALRQPEGTAELVPGGAVTLAWTVDGGAGELVFALAPVTDPAAAPTMIARVTVGPGDGELAWDGRDVDGALVPPEVYDLSAELRVDGAAVDGALRNLAIQGVTLTYPPAGETVVVTPGDLPVDLLAVTVSQRELDLAFAFDPDLDVPGDELVVDRRGIPGEFVSFERFVRFDGDDHLLAPVPAGVYTFVCDVDDPDTDLAYRVVGGTIDWRPAP